MDQNDNTQHVVSDYTCPACGKFHTLPPSKSVYMHRSITAYGTIIVAVAAMIGAILLRSLEKLSYEQYMSQLLLGIGILVPSPMQHIFGKKDDGR